MDEKPTINTTKIKQLTATLESFIANGTYKEGDALPSINKLSARFNTSRDTTFKALQILKEKGVIESVSTKGYYVCTSINNVLVMLDNFTPFKNDLYKKITANLPDNYKIDLFFHNYSPRAFNNVIYDNIGRYNLYVITSISDNILPEILNQLDHKRVLLIDFGDLYKDKFSYICQGFDTTLYECLLSGLDQLRKYKKINFMFPLSAKHPRSCITDFELFCRNFQFEFNICIKEELDASDIEKDNVYLFPRHSDLIEGVKLARINQLKLGENIGFITFNDTPMLEVIENGITCISTDFKQMGALAAEYIKTKAKIQTYIPTKLILRGSL